jgi:hypothetical protein
MTERSSDKRCLPRSDSIRKDEKLRLHSFERNLIAASRSSKVEIAVGDIRKKGLVATPRERNNRQRSVRA